ncbi:MAG: large-conductance mechanosensitive channel protein MscL [Muribaculaceae bacterium]
MGKFLQDFKSFAMKGNIIDMAVGVIVGGAFGAIVSSLVNDIIMPLVSLVTGGDGLKNLKYVIVHAKDADVANNIAAVQEVAINYGVFIQNIVDFLIIAFSIFVALRFIMKFKKKEEEAAPAPAGPTQEELLTEIRDLLAKDIDAKSQKPGK